jgi:hypothetical protein
MRMEEALPLFWICPFSIFFGLDSESGFDSLSLTLGTNEFFELHSSVLFQRTFWNLHHFLVSFFVVPLPFPLYWTGFMEAIG